MIRRLVLAPCVASLVACGSAAPVASDGGPADSGSADVPPIDANPGALGFDEAIFKASHNSYSGGTRLSILEQLESGVRFVELDLQEEDFATVGDFQVGHDSPGSSVSHEGMNPATNSLSDWLGQIATWSASHPTHAPITIGFDMRDDFSNNGGYADGDLAALNDTVDRVIGASLFTPADKDGAWPTVDGLRGRILVVLSGNDYTRLGYKRALGVDPAVDMNGAGAVVEVHATATDELWYWTGEYVPGAGVRWHRRGRYGAGLTPAVAINDDGWIVEAHRIAGATRVAYRVGRLGADFDVVWSTSGEAADGVAPTIRFDDRSGTSLSEIHADAGGAARSIMTGVLDPTLGDVIWTAAAPTDLAPFAKERAEIDARSIVVTSSASGVIAGGVLLYATDALAAPARIRFEQRMFVEFQPTDDDELLDGAIFFAQHAQLTREWSAEMRAMHAIVRLWSFDSLFLELDPPATFNATDAPFADWYIDYCRRVGAVE